MCSTAERNSPLSSLFAEVYRRAGNSVLLRVGPYIIARRYSYGRWPDLFANSLSTAVQSLA
jgi:hypothetical protein